MTHSEIREIANQIAPGLACYVSRFDETASLIEFEGTDANIVAMNNGEFECYAKPSLSGRGKLFDNLQDAIQWAIV